MLGPNRGLTRHSTMFKAIGLLRLVDVAIVAICCVAMPVVAQDFRMAMSGRAIDPAN